NLPGSAPLILRLREGGCTVGYIPLMWRRGYLQRVVPIRRLHFLGAQLTEFADFVMLQADPEMVEGVFRQLQYRGEWIEFIGHYIDETSPRAAAYTEVVQRWRGAEFVPYEPCWYIPISGRTWEEYVGEEVGREFVLRGVRRRAPLYAGVKWTVEEYAEVSETTLKEIVRLHAVAQQRKGRRSLFADDRRYRSFLRRILAESASQGWLQLFSLQIEHRWAAFLMGFVYRGVFYWWLQGFDPTYERLAPAKVLLWHVLQQGFRQQRWREFNFMGGDTEYKHHWAKRCRWFYRLRIPNWRGLAGWLNAWRYRG
ncbi:MAG: GNAT family N-acetyltransferase, partial [Bacteroidota bacterium]|nr:GNAT family N-acetyltransferase [Bacteroidota bacterium]